MEDSTAAKRLKEVYDGARKKSIRAFALHIGEDPSYVSKMISGERPVTESVADSIKIKYSINPEWLLHGHGDKYGQNDDKMNTPLPVGNITRTLADYIAMIENYSKTMSAAIEAGLISLKEGQQEIKEQLHVATDDLKNRLEGISSGLAASAKKGKDASGRVHHTPSGGKSQT